MLLPQEVVLVVELVQEDLMAVQVAVAEQMDLQQFFMEEQETHRLLVLRKEIMVDQMELLQLLLVVAVVSYLLEEQEQFQHQVLVEMILIVL